MNRIKEYLKNENIPVDMKCMHIGMSYTVFWMLIGLIQYARFKHTGNMIMIILVSSAVIGLIGLYTQKSGNAETGSVIFCYFLNIICMPAYFIFGGGVYSGAPILFTGGIMMDFFLMHGLMLIVSVSASIVWYASILIYVYFNPQVVSSVLTGYDILLNYISSFIIIILLTYIILAFQTSVYINQKERVSSSLHEIMAAGQTKSRFLANMSHELRTPMNAIIGMTEMLACEDKTNSKADETATINGAAYSLLTLINDVLTYSKIESGNLQLSPEQYNFSGLIKNVLNTAGRSTEKRKIDFFADIAPDIPSVLYGDDSIIQQIYEYILLGAINNTDTGRIMMDITDTVESEKNRVRIITRISDTGEGLSDSEYKSLFNSFDTYDSRTDSGIKKYGLELTICRELLKMMDGDMKVESIQGVGTAVTFEFCSFIIEKDPIVYTGYPVKKDVLIYVAYDNMRKRWNSLMENFGIFPEFASSYASFDIKLREKQYDFIMIQDYAYEDISGLIDLYRAADNTYVVTGYSHVFGEFGKCRIMRRPVSCVNICDILNGKWDRKDYEDKDKTEAFFAPDARVLVVDDNMVNVKVALNLLKQYDIEAVYALSGNSAIEKLKKGKYDIILLDQMMPVMDGNETLSRIRNLPAAYCKDVPVICMTSDAGSDLREKLIKSGFQGYLAKPVNIAKLETMLKEYLPPETIKSSPSIKNQAGTVRDSSHAENKTYAPEVQNVMPGLDIQRGLTYIGGNEETYDIILMAYYKEGMEKLGVISSEYSADGNIDLFITDMHSIKSSSASIGANEISAMFKDLELAGKAGDRRHIEENLPATMDKFKDLLTVIERYLKNRNAFE